MSAAPARYVLHYWPIKARAYLPGVIAAHGGLGMQLVPTDEPAGVSFDSIEATMPFGQLPMIVVDGKTHIAQSNAITRFLSKKAGLEGDNEADFIVSEMLVCEMNDIYDVLAKAHYSEPREAAMNTAFAEDLPWQFGLVDKLFRGRTHGGPWFASKLTAGDLAMGVAFDICLSLQPDCLDAFPALKEFAAACTALPCFGEYKAHEMYFLRK